MNSLKGSVVVEFLIVFPGFLFLMFLVMEIALMWSDRHIIKLAAFEAARSFAIERKEDPCYPQAINRAKARVAYRFSAIAPTLADIAGAFSSGTMAGNSPFAADPGNLGSHYGDALAHALTRLPAAFAMVQLADVKCQYHSNNRAVEATVTYYRSPKMPFAGEAVWATYMLKQLNHHISQHGLGSLVTFELDDLYYGIKARSPALDQVQAQLNDLNSSYNSMNSSLSSATGGELNLNDLTGGNNMIAQATAAFQNNAAPITERLDAFARYAQGVIYAVPHKLRLIPMEASARVVRDQVRAHGKHWQDARGFLIAPYTEGAWKKYTQSLSEGI